MGPADYEGLSWVLSRMQIICRKHTHTHAHTTPQIVNELDPWTHTCMHLHIHDESVLMTFLVGFFFVSRLKNNEQLRGWMKGLKGEAKGDQRRMWAKEEGSQEGVSKIQLKTFPLSVHQEIMSLTTGWRLDFYPYFIILKCNLVLEYKTILDFFRGQS